MATIEARIVSVQKDTSRDPAWYRITTDHDRVKRLDTQHDDKAKEAYGLMQAGEPALIEFTSKPRTLEDGRTFQNYYYDAARLLNGHQTAEIPTIPEIVEPMRTPAGETNERKWSIALQCGAKLAVASIPNLEARGMDTSAAGLQQVALLWGTWLYFTPVPERPSRQTEPEPAFTPDPGPDPSRVYGDDDIPF